MVIKLTVGAAVDCVFVVVVLWLKMCIG